MLSNPSPLFEALVKRYGPGAEAPSTPSEVPSPPDPSYAVRVRGLYGSHVYSFAVRAASEAEARAKFNGGMWSIVEIEEVATANA